MVLGSYGVSLFYFLWAVDLTACLYVSYLSVGVKDC